MPKITTLKSPRSQCSFRAFLTSFPFILCFTKSRKLIYRKEKENCHTGWREGGRTVESMKTFVSKNRWKMYTVIQESQVYVTCGF